MVWGSIFAVRIQKVVVVALVGTLRLERQQQSSCSFLVRLEANSRQGQRTQDMGNPSLMRTNQAINSHVPQLHRSIMNGDVGVSEDCNRERWMGVALDPWAAASTPSSAARQPGAGLLSCT